MDDAPKREDRKGFVRDTVRRLSMHVSRSEASFQHKLSQYDTEIKDLHEKVQLVEHESESILRNLERTISNYEHLKRKYHQATAHLAQGKKQNEKLVTALQEAKEQMHALKQEVEKLCAPPQ